MEAGDWIRLSAVIIGIPTAIVAVVGYWRVKKWRRMELASQILEGLWADEDLRLALMFLDWESRHVVLPKHFAPLCETSTGVFEHKTESLGHAMSMSNRRKRRHSKFQDLSPEFRVFPYTMYVEVYDRLFDYLARVVHYVQIGLIDSDDIRVLDYWLRKLWQLEYMKTEAGKPETWESVFQGYLDHYYKEERVPNLIRGDHWRPDRWCWVSGMPRRVPGGWIERETRQPSPSPREGVSSSPPGS